MRESAQFPNFLPGNWRNMPFRQFHGGVEIALLREEDPAVALLRYSPGASVPYHEHTGLETILVLEGVQSDERGDYAAGTLVLNPKGTGHSVWSEQGCTVLIQWEHPVKFCDLDQKAD